MRSCPGRKETRVTTIFVDLEFVREQAALMKHVRDGIQASAMKNDLDHVQSVLGSAELVSKCHEVTTNWSRKRDQMTKKLDAVAKALTEVGVDFDKLDDAYARAMGGK
jgi:uncharacterized protein YukE